MSGTRWIFAKLMDNFIFYFTNFRLYLNSKHGKVQNIGGVRLGWFSGSSKNYHFEMFSVSHFIIIALLLIVATCIFLYRDRLKSDKTRNWEIGVAISLIIIEVTYHIWMLINGNWDISHAIPLELCSISLILNIILLLTKKRSSTKYCYSSLY